ncbi:MAG: AAA family ATPase, partial [Candidatus Marinimicrobia bacterium]|nr:AAA family ATPase [Candidatus Neomarinimicrobiota bacterium]
WLDELLEKHESEYHYLFSCVYQAASEQSGTSLKQNYILPNITRRLLEAFMAFRQPQSTGNLWKQLEQIPYDKSTKVRILRFINTHSHHGEIGEPEHDLSILSEAQSVIREVLDLMATIDKDHVNAMISIATEANHDNGEGDQ